jgi:hypothetical protein
VADRWENRKFRPAVVVGSRVFGLRKNPQQRQRVWLLRLPSPDRTGVNVFTAAPPSEQHPA